MIVMVCSDCGRPLPDDLSGRYQYTLDIARGYVRTHVCADCFVWWLGRWRRTAA